jgi:hypothetical protein
MTANERLGEHIAEMLLEMTGHRGPPTDLQAIAHLLGVREIELTSELAEEGRLVEHESGFLIELRADRPATRQRFTLAHELGHAAVAVLEEDHPRVRYRARKGENQAEERLCDWIAAALLMPLPWLETQAAYGSDLNFPRLRLVAQRAGVSLAAAVVRLSEVGAHRCLLLRCRQAPSGWAVVGRAAVPGAWGPRVRLSDSAQAAMASSRRGGATELELSTDLGPVVVTACIEKNGGTGLVLVPDHQHADP